MILLALFLCRGRRCSILYVLYVLFNAAQERRKKRIDTFKLFYFSLFLVFRLFLSPTFHHLVSFEIVFRLDVSLVGETLIATHFVKHEENESSYRDEE